MYWRFPLLDHSLLLKHITESFFFGFVNVCIYKRSRTIHKARQWPKLMIFFVTFNERAGGFYRGIKPRARGEAELLYTPIKHDLRVY